MIAITTNSSMRVKPLLAAIGNLTPDGRLAPQKTKGAALRNASSVPSAGQPICMISHFQDLVNGLIVPEKVRFGHTCYRTQHTIASCRRWCRAVLHILSRDPRSSHKAPSFQAHAVIPGHTAIPSTRRHSEHTPSFQAHTVILSEAKNLPVRNKSFASARDDRLRLECRIQKHGVTSFGRLDSPPADGLPTKRTHPFGRPKGRALSSVQIVRRIRGYRPGSLSIQTLV